MTIFRWLMKNNTCLLLLQKEKEKKKIKIIGIRTCHRKILYIVPPKYLNCYGLVKIWEYSLYLWGADISSLHMCIYTYKLQNTYSPFIIALLLCLRRVVKCCGRMFEPSDANSRWQRHKTMHLQNFKLLWKPIIK